ncbi:TIGR02186 family protein [Dongia deserti]|uniref:TIGR02186 family protein n=1 Tax=Dongia deserti TaxID=2268030 RepID=UPI000E64925B|nr:TIGR02186 family protein [Dongia deserti]
MRRRLIPCLVAVLGLALAAPAAAKGIVADVDDHLVEITTDFAGQDILVFGAIDGPGDVVLVMRGPAGRVAVHRKERLAGVWVNADSIEFEGVPSLYGVASSRPLFEILTPDVLDRYQLGVGRVQFRDVAGDVPGIGPFRTALVQQKKKQGLYADRVGRVTFIGATLFRANLHLPSNVPTGTFLIDVYLVRDGRIVDAQNMPLVISKVGFGADIFKYANARSIAQRFAYGVAAVVVALLTGWLAHLAFRKR